jgi:hypothetical protein
MNSPSEMTSKLKTSLSTAEVLEAQKKLKTIKYPVRALSNAVRIKKKLDHFDPVIRNKLVKNMDQEINAYRQVRGDGNCFFRALAFSIISNKKLTYFKDIFRYIDDIELNSCKKESIPQQFKEFYRDDLLR